MCRTPIKEKTPVKGLFSSLAFESRFPSHKKESSVKKIMRTQDSTSGEETQGKAFKSLVLFYENFQAKEKKVVERERQFRMKRQTKLFSRKQSNSSSKSSSKMSLRRLIKSPRDNLMVSSKSNVGFSGKDVQNEILNECNSVETPMESSSKRFSFCNAGKIHPRPTPVSRPRSANKRKIVFSPDENKVKVFKENEKLLREIETKNENGDENKEMLAIVPAKDSNIHIRPQEISSNSVATKKSITIDKAGSDNRQAYFSDGGNGKKWNWATIASLAKKKFEASADMEVNQAVQRAKSTGDGLMKGVDFARRSFVERAKCISSCLTTQVEENPPAWMIREKAQTAIAEGRAKEVGHNKQLALVGLEYARIGEVEGATSRSKSVVSMNHRRDEPVRAKRRNTVAGDACN